MPLIPTDNLIDWTANVQNGIDGGIPSTRTNIIEMILDADSNTDNAIAINEYIANASVGDILLIPEGEWNISSLIIFQENGLGYNGITLRGVTTETSVLNATVNGGIVVGGSGGTTDTLITDGISKGSTSITVTSTADFSVGKLMRISIENDVSIPVIYVYGGLFDLKQESRGQLVKITGVSGNDISFFPALYDNYGSGDLRARAAVLNFKQNDIGLENFTIDLEHADAGIGIKFESCDSCWVLNVNVFKVKNYHFALEDCYRCEMLHCFLDERIGEGSNGAGLLVNSSSANLFQNSVINRNFPLIEVNHGSSGNVFGYLACPSSLKGIDTNHGPHNSYNLYEGCLTITFESDGYTGSASRDILFRNWIFEGLFLKRFTREYSVIGNILGTTSFELNISYGYPNIGNAFYWNTAPPRLDPISGITEQAGLITLVNAGDYAVATTDADTFDIGTFTVDPITGIFTTSNPHKLVPNAVTSVQFRSSGVLPAGLSEGVKYIIHPDNWTPTTFTLYNTTITDSGTGTHYCSIPIGTYIIYTTGGQAGKLSILSDYIDARTAHVILFNLDYGPAEFYTTRGPEGYQELDGEVEPSTIDKGNYSPFNSSLSSLGGDTLLDSLYLSEKPDWFDEEGTKDFPPVDPLGSSKDSPSFVLTPAGSRYLASLPPAAPVITSSDTKEGFQDESFSYHIITDIPADSFSADDLPSWAILNASTGAITGTPDVVAVSNVTLHATNQIGTGDLSLTLTVSASRRALITCLTKGAVHPAIFVGPFVLSSENDGSGGTLVPILLASFDISDEVDTFSRASVAGYTGNGETAFQREAAIDVLRGSHYVGSNECVILEEIPTPCILEAPTNIQAIPTYLTFAVTFQGITVTESLLRYEWRLDNTGSWTSLGTDTTINSDSTLGDHIVEIRAVSTSGVSGVEGSSNTFSLTQPPAVTILTEDFEGSGTPSGWFGGSFDYTDAPINGSQSGRVVDPGQVLYLPGGVINHSELFIKFRLRVETLGEGRFFRIVNGDFSEIFSAYLTADSTFTMTDTGLSGNLEIATPFTTGVDYYCWVYWKQGTGDAVIEFAFNTVNSLPSIGDSRRVATNATSVGPAQGLGFISSSTGNTVVFDDIVVSTGDWA